MTILLLVHTIDLHYRLRIDYADVHLSHRPVGGSRNVFKAMLKGEMRAAKVTKPFQTFSTSILRRTRTAVHYIIYRQWLLVVINTVVKISTTVTVL